MTDTTVLNEAANRPVYPLRRVLILIAALAAVSIAYGQMALNIGQTPAEFSAGGDSTLRVAGFAFAIWGLIYAGLVIYAVYQAIPSTTENPTIRALGWPSFIAFAGIGLWIVASAADWQWGSVGIILVSLLVLLVPLTMRASLWRKGATRQRALVVWPLALLAGWLTIASVVNVITVVTSQGLLPEALGPKSWAAIAVFITTAAALLLTWRIDQWTYPLPIAWGLFGAFVAERSESIPLAFVCLAGSVAVLLGGLWLTLARKRGVKSHASAYPVTLDEAASRPDTHTTVPAPPSPVSAGAPFDRTPDDTGSPLSAADPRAQESGADPVHRDLTLPPESR